MSPASTPPWMPELCRLPRLAAMLGLAELVVVVLALAPDGSRHWTFGELLSASGFALWLALAVTASLCMLRQTLSRLPPVLGAIAATVLATLIAVVCAGAKAILDLPLTLEVLETHGVPVVGLGTDTLPGFYSRSSGLPIDVRVETPREAAAIIAASRHLDAQHAVLIVVPIPAEKEFRGAEAAITQAASEADRTTSA